MSKNPEKIIESGDLEAYVLGMLDEKETAAVQELVIKNATVKAELEAIENALQEYSAQPLRVPAAADLLAIIGQVENEKASLRDGELPFMNRYADAAAWTEAVKYLIPADDKEPFIMIPLKDNKEGTLSLVQTSTDIDAEEHTDEQESFLILQGTCTCYVGKDVFYLQAGDYLEIPMFTDHNVIITSVIPVVAILQRLKVA